MPKLTSRDTMAKAPAKQMTDTPIPFNVILASDKARQGLNNYYIGFIPYCLICGVPLNWHYYEGIIFSCPVCNSTWSKDKNWNDEAAKQKSEDAIK